MLKEGYGNAIGFFETAIPESVKAAEELKKDGISCEVVDLRTLKPVDMETVNRSVAKTGRALVTIAEWGFASVTDSVIKGIYDACFRVLKAPVKAVTLPDCPAPASKSLEEAYYIYAKDIVKSVKEILR